MKKLTTKEICLILIAILLLGMTACKSTKKEQKDKTVETIATETTPIATEPTEAPTEPTPTETTVEETLEAGFTETNDTVYATQDVNVRSGPNTFHDKVGVLGMGESVERIAEGDCGWSKVIFNGEPCFIANVYLKTTSGDSYTEAEIESADKQTYKEVSETVYATQDVNVRRGPSTKHVKVGELPRGESVTRIGIGSDGWDKVIYNNETCYIANFYLTTTEPTQ